LSISCKKLLTLTWRAWGDATPQMGGTAGFVNDLKNCRRDETLCTEAGDMVTQHQLYAMSPIVSSGVSSRKLFDVVVGCVKVKRRWRVLSLTY
jgi:hypothetical protein